MSLRVLAGERPENIPQETAPTAMTVDWRELQRWGISEQSLPPGSVVRFRQPSFWQLYKWQIVSVLAFCAIQALLIVVLLVERRRRRRAIIELDKRVRFETLLSKLSAEFTNLPNSKVDALVKQWLVRLEDSLGDATILFFEVPRIDEGVFTSPSGEMSSRPRALAEGAVKEDEWCLDQLRRGFTINLADLPSALSADKIGGKPTADLKSLLAIPVSVHGATYALSLETTGSYRVWPKDLAPQFRLVGEIFAGALERKRAGEELQKTRNDLAHVARLTAMGEMAASIAHEVNQPLAAIATYGDACVRLLSGESPNVKKSLEAINHIIGDSMRASEVVKRIRRLVKKTSHETSPQDLNQIITEMVAVTDADVLNRSVQLKLHLAPDLPWILGDRVELQQVVLNLIVNGIEAMSDITDRARQLEITSAMNGGEQVVVAVQDSGVGLNSELQRIFDPFVTTKPNGLGLGLSISRTIIEAHGGRLWAESNRGPGASFQFTLPTAEGADNGD
jgi:C4-dicarboxylate-specific signal transduction histidine kinase